MSALMRGADLSTMSGHSQQGGEGGQGASLQGEESDIMEADDAAFVSGVLNRKIDEIVIQYHFGEGVRPLARAVVMVPTRQDVQADVAVDTFLLSSGVELGQRETLERYGRSPRKPDDKPLTAPAPQGAVDPNADPNAEADRFQANEAQRDLLVRSDDVFRGATYQALKPLADRLAGVLELPDQAYEFGLKRLVEDLPAILREINADPANAKALEDAMSAGWLNGVVADAVQAHKSGQPTLANEYDEDKHPRGPGGRWASQGEADAEFARTKPARVTITHGPRQSTGATVEDALARHHDLNSISRAEAKSIAEEVRRRDTADVRLDPQRTVEHAIHRPGLTKREAYVYVTEHHDAPVKINRPDVRPDPELESAQKRVFDLRRHSSDLKAIGKKDSAARVAQQAEAILAKYPSLR
jgi:hypothetical protein